MSRSRRRRPLTGVRLPRFRLHGRSASLVVVGAVVLAFLLVQSNFNSTILSLSRIEAQQMAIRVLSTSLEHQLARETARSEMFHIQVNSGQAFIQPNTAAIERVAAQATLAIQSALKRLPEEPIYIPLGQALGSKLLAAYGPDVPVGLVPYGAVSIDFSEEFHQAGINQVLFVVYLDTDTQVHSIVTS